MNIFTKAIALTSAIIALAGVTLPSSAAPLVHKKGGYVHAHTFTKKNGTVVHVSGHYRHATKAPAGKMIVAPKTVKPKM